MSLVRDTVLKALKEGQKTFAELKKYLEESCNLHVSENYLRHILWELQDYNIIERKIIYRLKDQ